MEIILGHYGLIIYYEPYPGVRRRIPYLFPELVRSTGKFGIIGAETVRRRNHLEIWVRVRVRVRVGKKNGSTGTYGIST